MVSGAKSSRNGPLKLLKTELQICPGSAVLEHDDPSDEWRGCWNSTKCSSWNHWQIETHQYSYVFAITCLFPSIWLHLNSTSILYFPFSPCIDQCIPRSNHMQRASLTSGITARRSSASCSRSGKAEPAWPSDRTTWIWSEIANKLWDRCSWEKMTRSNMSSTKCSNKWNTASLHVAPLGLSDAQQTRVQGRACHCAAQGRAVRTASKWMVWEFLKSSQKTPVVQPEIRKCILTMLPLHGIVGAFPIMKHTPVFRCQRDTAKTQSVHLRSRPSSSKFSIGNPLVL